MNNRISKYNILLVISDLIYTMSHEIRFNDESKNYKLSTKIRVSYALHLIFFILLSVHLLIYLDSKVEHDILGDGLNINILFFVILNYSLSMLILKKYYNEKTHSVVIDYYKHYFKNYDLYILVYSLLLILLLSYSILIILGVVI